MVVVDYVGRKGTGRWLLNYICDWIVENRNTTSCLFEANTYI